MMSVSHTKSPRFHPIARPSVEGVAEPSLDLEEVPNDGEDSEDDAVELDDEVPALPPLRRVNSVGAGMNLFSQINEQKQILSNQSDSLELAKELIYKQDHTIKQMKNLIKQNRQELADTRNVLGETNTLLDAVMNS